MRDTDVYMLIAPSFYEKAITIGKLHAFLKKEIPDKGKLEGAYYSSFGTDIAGEIFHEGAWVGQTNQVFLSPPDLMKEGDLEGYRIFGSKVTSIVKALLLKKLLIHIPTEEEKEGIYTFVLSSNLTEQSLQKALPEAEIKTIYLPS